MRDDKSPQSMDTSVLQFMASQERSGMSEQAIAYYDELSTRLTSDLPLAKRIRLLRDLAHFSRDANRLDAALAYWNDLIALGEANDVRTLFFSDYVYLATVLIASGDLLNAQTAFERGIHAIDSRNLPHADLRLFHGAKQDCARVAEACTVMIEASPDFAPAYFSRALAYRELGQIDQALADLDSAHRTDPRHGAVWSAQRSVILREREAALAEAAKGNSMYRAFFPEGVEFCSVDWNGDSNSVVSINIYDQKGGRFEPVVSTVLADVIADLKQQGWEDFRTEGHHEGIAYYFKRQKRAADQEAT